MQPDIGHLGDARIFIDRMAYADLEAWHAAAARLRKEEIRWVTPVRHFMRQAQGDYRLGDVRLRAGDWLLLSYLSANRDEAVFEDPFRFDIGRRNADEHLAFGIGVHFCLGAHLARMEIEAFLRELLPRLEHVELAGEPESMATTFVGGPKRLPIRFRLRRAA
jgi:cytochrome P450